jgi:uncharacterized protein YeaO (DUF488 family)
MKMMIKRIYEPAAKSDGFRVLVDRLWPRGISKADAKLDVWLRDIGPSTALRKWFNHDPTRWLEFQRRYFAELKGKRALLAILKEQATISRSVTLLYSAKDEQHNQAVALRSFLSKYSATNWLVVSPKYQSRTVPRDERKPGGG